MREEIKRILQMVKDGKLSPEDAAELIEAFEQGEAADAGAGTDSSHEVPPPPPPSAPEFPKDPFKAFVEAIDKIGKDATESVNWQEVAEKVRESARKGVDALKTGMDQVSKGKVNFSWGSGIHESREVALPISIPSGKTLKIDNSCGDVKVVGGFGSNVAHARAKFRAGTSEEAKAKADSYTLIVEESDHMVLIRQPDVSGLTVDVEVQVSAPVGVEVRCTSGDVEIKETKGSARVNSTHGDVKITGADGSLDISCTSGDVHVEDVASPSITIEAKDGDLTLKSVNGNVNARTAHGDVKLRGWSGKTLSVESVSGDVDAELTDGVTGTINVRTVDGDVKIATDDGCDCRVSLSTLRGDVRCDLTLADEARTGQRVTGKLGSGTGTLDVSAVSGDISVLQREHRVQ